jgi:hypothetical protein
MIIIFAQRGATSWGFQIGKYYAYLNYPRFWRTSGLLRWGVQS